MSDKIYGINDIASKHNNVKIQKKTESTDAFAKILENKIAGTDTESTGSTAQVQPSFQSYYVNPLSKISSNDTSVKQIEENLTNLLDSLELFSNLLGNKSIDPEEIAPLAGKLKDDVGSILKDAEVNNVPNKLKNIVKESSALAYAAVEKLNALV